MSRIIERHYCNSVPGLAIFIGNIGSATIDNKGYETCPSSFIHDQTQFFPGSAIAAERRIDEMRSANRNCYSIAIAVIVKQHTSVNRPRYMQDLFTNNDLIATGIDVVETQAIVVVSVRKNRIDRNGISTQSTFTDKDFNCNCKGKPLVLGDHMNRWRPCKINLCNRSRCRTGVTWQNDDRIDPQKSPNDWK